VLSRGLVPPLGTLPGAFVADRVKAWASGVLVGGGDKLVFATRDEAFARQVADALRAARLPATRSKDMIGAELAACAEDAAALAVATAGPEAAGAAADRVLAELGAYARRAGFKLAGEEPVAEHGTDGASISLLATRLKQAGVDAPVLTGLADVIEGRVEAERWTASLAEEAKVA
jgi:glycerol-3-phosphate dehydrogenase (NAD(P)+)